MRKEVENKFIDEAIDATRAHVGNCMIRHGRGTFASKHEAYGIMAEEVKELLDAIERNESPEKLFVEFKDVAQVCIFAMACIKAKTMDW